MIYNVFKIQVMAKTFFFIAICLFAFNSYSGAATPPDSLRVRWMEGKKYILHKVESQETLSSL